MDPSSDEADEQAMDRHAAEPRGSTSLWLDTAGPAAHDTLAADLHVDVAIIGAGITGLTTALLLKRRGARVAVLDRHVVGGGATGFTTAKASALQETVYRAIRAKRGRDGAAAYAQANMQGLAAIAAIVADEGIECDLEQLPAFTYAADDAEVSTVEEEATAAREAGLPVAETSDVPLPFDVPAAVRLDGQLQFHPVRYVRGLADRVVGGGSRVFERTQVVAVDEGAPCTVVTGDDQRVTADHVVVATNYPLLDRGVFFARLEATRSYLVAARIAAEDAPRGMLISAGQPTRSVRPYLAGDAGWLLVGGEGHRTGARDAQPERYAALEAFAREHWDVRELGYRWSTQDGVPVDRMPYIGRYTPRSKRLWVASGFQKWGMTTGSFAGGLLADLITGRDHELAGAFDPNRATVASAPKLAQLNLHVAAEFVGGRLRPAEASSLDEVPAGEARVLRTGLGKTGVFRDEAGTPHAVSLRCTHLGCLLRFNDAERSWDCPCHGSRFGIDGEVLAGPATAPLERRESPG